MDSNEINLSEGTVENDIKKDSTLKRYIRLLLKSKTGTLGFIIILIVTFVAVFAPYLAPHDPTQQNYTHILMPPFWLEGGSFDFVFGTDNLGRDILSRLIYGSRVSLIVGVLAVLVAGFIGLTIGLVSGYFGGWIDNVSMRLVEAFLAIPNIVFALVFLRISGPGLSTLIIALGITNWVMYARVIRSEVLSLREREYIKASLSFGVKNLTIIKRHLIPNVMSSFIVISTLSIASTILAEAALSFLGLGIQPPDISWGGMLSTGRDYLADSWGLATFPGLAITITTLGIMLFGDWLRDTLDPRLASK